MAKEARERTIESGKLYGKGHSKDKSNLTEPNKPQVSEIMAKKSDFRSRNTYWRDPTGKHTTVYRHYGPIRTIRPYSTVKPPIRRQGSSSTPSPYKCMKAPVIAVSGCGLCPVRSSGKAFTGPIGALRMPTKPYIITDYQFLGFRNTRF